MSLLNLELRLIDVLDMVQEIEKLKKKIAEAKLPETVAAKHDHPAREETAKDQNQNEDATESGEPNPPSED